MRCLIVDDDPLLSDLLEHFVSKVDFLGSVSVCHSALEALSLLRNEQYDLLFLDIEMPEMSGMDLLRALDTDFLVIMVTSHPDFALESYRYTVVDYLVKPLEFPRFFQAVSKARRLYKSSDSSDKVLEVFVKEGRDLVKVDLRSVYYIEAASNYVSFVCEEERRMTHSSMKTLEERLPGNFVRVHRSFIVNAAKIDKIESMSIAIGKRSIPLSARYRERLLQRLTLLA